MSLVKDRGTDRPIDIYCEADRQTDRKTAEGQRDSL